MMLIYTQQIAPSVGPECTANDSGATKRLSQSRMTNSDEAKQPVSEQRRLPFLSPAGREPSTLDLLAGRSSSVGPRVLLLVVFLGYLLRLRLRTVINARRPLQQIRSQRNWNLFAAFSLHRYPFRRLLQTGWAFKGAKLRVIASGVLAWSCVLLNVVRDGDRKLNYAEELCPTAPRGWPPTVDVLLIRERILDRSGVWLAKCFRDYYWQLYKTLED